MANLSDHFQTTITSEEPVDKTGEQTGNKQGVSSEAELQRQIEHERTLREVAERERETYRLLAQSKPESARKEEPEVDDLGEVDLVDIVSGNNVEGLSKVMQATIRKTLKSMGVTTRGDVEQMVAERASELSETGHLVERYPGLGEVDSDFKKEARRQFELIERDPHYSKLPDIRKVEIAAMRAESALNGKQQSKAADEADRRESISFQQGAGGNRGRESNSSGELTQGEKEACRIYGVSEEQFKKQKDEMKAFRR